MAVSPAVSSSHDSPNVNIMPPLIFFLCLVAGGVAQLLDGWFLPLPFYLHFFTGLVVTLAGAWFMMWGHTRFMNLGANVRTNRPAHTLVREGAYRLSRNPMYVGIIAAMFGVGVMTGGVWVMLAAVPLALYLSCYVVPREEAYLFRRFGDSYAQYCETVRRWL